MDETELEDARWFTRAQVVQALEARERGQAAKRLTRRVAMLWRGICWTGGRGGLMRIASGGLGRDALNNPINICVAFVLTQLRRRQMNCCLRRQSFRTRAKVTNFGDC
jgi:predicted Rossmann-fold nucleotide-binding protein